MWQTFHNPQPTARPDAASAPPPDDILAFALRLGFQPDQQQAAVLASNAKRGILLCCRQWGKSTVGAIRAVHHAFTRPGSLVLVAAPTLRQSGELIRKCAAFLTALGLKPRGDGSNAASLVFPNGSRIVGLPGSPTNIVGFSAVSLLIVDEAALVSDFLYRVLRPMLAVADGDLWLLSSAWWQEGFFYESWTSEKLTTQPGSKPDHWQRFRVTAAECPRLSPAFLDEERTVQGEQAFAQQYNCEFQPPEGALVSRELLEAIWDDEKPVWI